MTEDSNLPDSLGQTGSNPAYYHLMISPSEELLVRLRSFNKIFLLSLSLYYFFASPASGTIRSRSCISITFACALKNTQPFAEKMAVLIFYEAHERRKRFLGVFQNFVLIEALSQRLKRPD